jgi:hypothetical protein
MILKNVLHIETITIIQSIGQFKIFGYAKARRYNAYY